MTDENDGPADAATQAEVRQQILQHSMLTTAEVDIQLGREWASATEIFSGRLVCLPRHHQGGLIPAFQLDSEARRVRPLVAELNLVLGAQHDPWRAAAWWLTPAADVPEGTTPADVAVTGTAEHYALIRLMAHDYGGSPDANDGPDLDRSIGRGAREHVLAHTTLTFAETDEVLGAPGAAFQLAALEGSLIAIDDDGTMRVPAFQLDPERGRVRPIVSELNVVIGAAANPWGCASWWLTASAALPGGMAPADALDGGHDDLVRRLAGDVAAAWEPTVLPLLGMTLDEARAKLTALHFAKEMLSTPERGLLQVAEGLLRLIDLRLAGGGTAR